MDDITVPWNRLGLAAALAEKSETGYISRTGLMKFAYFLQVLRKVPLGYHFTLYCYGPFDSDVLFDLDSASALGAVTVKTVEYPGGYCGYEVKPGPEANEVKSEADSFLTEHQKDIDWVVDRFGSLNTAHLELVSTLVFADREAAEANEKLTIKELAGQVRSIKPRFTEQEIVSRAEWLQQGGLLESVKD